MATYIVSRQVIYSQEFEVEADSEQEAIEIAKSTPVATEDSTFLDTDYYEIVGELTEE